MENHWLIYALASAVFAGLTTIFAKIGVAHIPSNIATLIRTVVIALFLTLLVFIRREWTQTFLLDKRALIFLIFSGLTTGLSWMCYFRALQLGPASLVAPIDKLSLLVAVFCAVLFLHEHLGWLQWTGIILMSCGALLVVLK